MFKRWTMNDLSFIFSLLRVKEIPTYKTPAWRFRLRRSRARRVFDSLPPTPQQEHHNRAYLTCKPKGLLLQVLYNWAIWPKLFSVSQQFDEYLSATCPPGLLFSLICSFLMYMSPHRHAELAH